MGALLSELSFDPRHIDLENISVSEIWNVRTLWQHVECRSHVFSSLDEKKFAQRVLLPLCQERKTFSEIFSVFLQSPQNSIYVEEKAQLDSLNISEVIQS